MSEQAIRKRRLTQKEIQEFAYWALSNNAYDKYTCGRIKQIYKEINPDIELSLCTIRLQKDRWVLIDDKIYDVHKPYMFPTKKQNTCE